VQNSAGACPPPASWPAAPPQQIWPRAPQATPDGVLHEPLEQVPVTPAAVQACPTPTHCRVVCPPMVEAMQHPPPLQALPAQQGC
jgi:hypothetical protein